MFIKPSLTKMLSPPVIIESKLLLLYEISNSDITDMYQRKQSRGVCLMAMLGESTVRVIFHENTIDFKKCNTLYVIPIFQTFFIKYLNETIL